MSEHFDESWEFYCPDPEIAELMADHEATNARPSTDHKRFMFRFEGSRGMEQGQFFTGLSFGKVSLPLVLFSWEAEAFCGLNSLFEKCLHAVPYQKRGLWLSEKVLDIWNEIPQRKRQIIASLVAWEPGHREKKPGRPCGPVLHVASTLGIEPSTVRRSYISARSFLLSRLLDIEDMPRCRCGCGGITSFAYTPNRRYGHVVGSPVAYLPGHNAKGKRKR